MGGELMLLPGVDVGYCDLINVINTLKTRLGICSYNVGDCLCPFRNPRSRPRVLAVEQSRESPRRHVQNGELRENLTRVRR